MYFALCVHREFRILKLMADCHALIFMLFALSPTVNTLVIITSTTNAIFAHYPILFRTPFVRLRYFHFGLRTSFCTTHSRSTSTRLAIYSYLAININSLCAEQLYYLCTAVQFQCPRHHARAAYTYDRSALMQILKKRLLLVAVAVTTTVGAVIVAILYAIGNERVQIAAFAVAKVPAIVDDDENHK